MIRRAQPKDKACLAALYAGSIYGELPAMVEWALRVVPERVVIVEEQREVLAAVYTMVCGYSNLWLSYLAFKDEAAAKRLIDHLMKVRETKGLRNLYVFCPREFLKVRVHLITRGFVPECLREIDGINYIVEMHDGTFNPSYQPQAPQETLPINVRKGKRGDVEALAKILHESLPRDFGSVEEARNCVRRWLKEMSEYTIVAEYNGSPVGVSLLSREIAPVIDKNLAMLCYIAVDERFRGRGVGRGLVERACEVLRGKGKRSMEVDVSVRNISARIFYTKMGFYPFWLSKGYMPHDDGVFYRLDF
jgi:ribosomal protein S18 acetylase RimI-like enzyme